MIVSFLDGTTDVVERKQQMMLFGEVSRKFDFYFLVKIWDSTKNNLTL